MSNPTKTKEKAADAFPPAIRLIRAFHQAVESSRPSSDPIQEAIRLEALMIAAEASYMALSRFAELWHRVSYGEGPEDEVGEEQIVLEGYESWLDGADPIRNRLALLKETQFASIAGERFETQWEEAKAAWGDARNRRKVEYGALRADQLAELLAKPKVFRESYDDAESSP